MTLIFCRESYVTEDRQDALIQMRSGSAYGKRDDSPPDSEKSFGSCSGAAIGEAGRVSQLDPAVSESNVTADVTDRCVNYRFTVNCFVSAGIVVPAKGHAVQGSC